MPQSGGEAQLFCSCNYTPTPEGVMWCQVYRSLTNKARLDNIPEAGVWCQVYS